MSWLTVSRIQRKQASEIISKLRLTMSRENVAEKFGISPTYVSFAMSGDLRADCDGYLCPASAITKILAHEDSKKNLTPKMEGYVA